MTGRLTDNTCPHHVIYSLQEAPTSAPLPTEAKQTVVPVAMVMHCESPVGVAYPSSWEAGFQQACQVR